VNNSAEVFAVAPTNFEFAHPVVLLSLVLVPLLAWLLGKRGPLPSVTLPSLAALEGLGRTPRRHSGWLRWIVPLAALALLCIALARPRLPRGDLPDPTKGIDIMLTLDFSRSMAEMDFHIEGKRTSRRAALEKVVAEFVGKRPNDRIGIVCFARSPFLVSPLTLDHEWALNSLRETDYATGTAIGEGIAASSQFLKRNSQRSKVIILVTDGQNMTGRQPLQIAPSLLRDGISLYSILIGPEVVTPSAAARHELNRASRITGGQFFQARDTSTLERVYMLIDQLEKKALLEKHFVSWNELFPQFVGAALALLLLDFIWNDAAKRRIP
jgi:Ca-activated chloride channel family protein